MNNITSTASYAASGGTVWLGLNSSEWGIVGVVVGIVIALATFAVNYWFQKKRLKLAEKK